ncbi:MAG TPA: ATP synthase F1 subunit gamma, partial [Bacillota bacterium]|nr:ATP synthase F1 subunit gamma [Bacillota bacterium]
DLKIRIKSTQNIEHITKAMQMVAAARLKKAQTRLESARPYARKIAEATLDLVSLTPWSFHRMLRPHGQIRNVLIIVFTGDRGLAGGFHNKIADGAIDFGAKLGDNVQVSYYVIGKKGACRFLQRQVPVNQRFESVVSGVSFGRAQKLAREIIEQYKLETFDKIYLYYAKFYSAMNQKPRAFQLLPIDPSQSKKQLETSGLFVFEPDRNTFVSSILDRYVESEIFRAFLETEVGELGARMTAMSAATDNATDIIESYKLKYNRLRQGQITKQITEIVAGAEALNKQ